MSSTTIRSHATDETSWSLTAALTEIMTRVGRSAADRALRRELSGLDAHILRDIGIAEDEISRIRSHDAFTPRAWN